MQNTVKIETNQDTIREERRKYIGGSDMAAIMGLSKWATPLQIYNAKLNLKEREIKNKEAVHFGNVLEDIVAREFAKRTGKRVRRKNKTIIHPEYEYFGAKVDREIVGENAVLECKTTNEYNKDEWQGDEIPQEYILQVMWYIFVGGYDRGYIACLIGGQRFVMKEIERDEAIITIMQEAAHNFWQDNVLPAIPPEAQAGDNKEFDTPEIDDEIILPETTKALVLELDEVKKEANGVKKKKDELEAKIKQQMASHKIARTGDYVIKWNVSTQERLDTKAIKANAPDIASKYINIITVEKITYKAVG